MTISHQLRLALALAVIASPTNADTIINDCNAQATAQHIQLGNAHKAFMSQCIKDAGAAQESPLGPGNTATEAESAAAKKAVADTLKDPKSAQFRNLVVHGAAVCGEVNAKNAFGGYVGFQPFAYVDGRAVVMPTVDARRMMVADSKIRAACK